VKIVIPAEAGIHVATVKVKMDPRLRGDDDTNAFARMTIRTSISLLCPLFVDIADYWTQDPVTKVLSAEVVHY
jgi:hypothetical protein